MARGYFKRVPNILYLDRENREFKNFTQAKNLFRRIKLRSIALNQLTAFEKYSIIGNERPDQIAYKFYRDPTLDWVVLLANNILNVQSEWPMDNMSFERYLLDKYGSYDKIYETVHHESLQISNLDGEIIFPGGIKVDQDYTFDYFDYSTGQYETINDMTIPVTNYMIEERRQDALRNIRILRVEYLELIESESEELFAYKKGSSQYVNKNLKRVDDIRIK